MTEMSEQNSPNTQSAASEHVCGPDCTCGCAAGLTIPTRSAARSQQHLVDTYREALNAIVAAATEPLDSMRSERNQLRERGEAMLAIAREALRVPE